MLLRAQLFQVDMHQGGHGQEMEPGEVPGDEAGVAGVVSQTQTAMAEAGAEGLTWTDGQAAAVGETVSYQVWLLTMLFLDVFRL